MEKMRVTFAPSIASSLGGFGPWELNVNVANHNFWTLWKHKQNSYERMGVFVGLCLCVFVCVYAFSNTYKIQAPKEGYRQGETDSDHTNGAIPNIYYSI